MDQAQRDMVARYYLATHEAIIRVAYRQVHDHDLAEDLAQEVFLLAMAKSETFATHPNPVGWLLKCVTNLARNENRRHSHTEVSLELVPEPVAAELSLGIEEVLPAGLSPEEREVIHLHFGQRLSHREIAELLGITEGTCRSRLSRALAHCRRLMPPDLF